MWHADSRFNTEANGPVICVISARHQTVLVSNYTHPWTPVSPDVINPVKILKIKVISPGFLTDNLPITLAYNDTTKKI